MEPGAASSRACRKPLMMTRFAWLFALALSVVVLAGGCSGQADLQLLSLSCGSNNRFVFPQVARGEVVNASSRPRRDLTAVVVFKGRSGSVLETVSVRLDDELMPGERRRFQAPFIADANFQGCAVAFTDQAGRVIPHGVASPS